MLNLIQKKQISIQNHNIVISNVFIHPNKSDFLGNSIIVQGYLGTDRDLYNIFKSFGVIIKIQRDINQNGMFF